MQMYLCKFCSFIIYNLVFGNLYTFCNMNLVKICVPEKCIYSDLLSCIV